MEQNENKDGFSYTYSAREQEEIKNIRSKYVAEEILGAEDKMERLRRLDAGVTKKGTIASIIIGIFGAMTLGTGMSLAMTELGDFIGDREISMLVGIATGLVGIIGVALAYPIYNLLVKREREKIAPEILRLTDELMK